jgi:hypothetical protein
LEENICGGADESERQQLKMNLWYRSNHDGEDGTRREPCKATRATPCGASGRPDPPTTNPAPKLQAGLDLYSPVIR